MGTQQLISGADLDKVQGASFLGGQLVYYTHKSPNKETDNEDSLAIIPFDEQSGILLIADGLGGQPRGDLASFMAVSAFVQSLNEARNAAMSLRDGILNGFELANRSIIESGNGSATTLVLIEMRGNSIRPYHVGDSMSLLVGQRGKIKLQTMAHSPVGYAIESGMLDENEALHHHERNIVSNVVGCTGMRIEVGAELMLSRYDTLVIGSDGLFDNFYIEEIVEKIRKGPMGELATALVSSCYTRMTAPEQGKPSHPDDMSLLLFRRSQ